MVEKPEASNRKDKAPDESPQPPGDEVALAPEPTGIVQQAEAQEEQGGPTRDGQPVLPPHRKQPRDLFDWLTLAVAVAAVCFYGWQANSLSRQVAALSETIELMKNDQRAWVGGIEPRLDAGPPIKAIIALRNFGQSPALKIKSKVELRIKGLQEVPPDPPPVEGPGSTSVLQPTQEMTTDCTPDKPVGIADITGRKVAAYFVGRIEYEDIFEESHHTTFAYIFKPVPGDRGTWTSLKSGNTAD